MTAVTADASENVAFYTEVLGLRLVKKTVNQDDVSAYHLFYGDELGRPGTEITFFDWPSYRLSPNQAGTGEVSSTALRIPNRTALEWWTKHLDESGVQHKGVEEDNGRTSVAFTDPEGQRLRLVDDGAEDVSVPGGEPWEGSPVPREVGIRGLSGVDLSVGDPEPTSWVLTEVLGFRQTNESAENGARVLAFEVGPGGPGTEVRLISNPDTPVARPGRGGVHHVAFRTPDDKEHAAWRERIARAGLGVTHQIDRYYFRSIYFREPGGILFEIATDGPGFATDEDPKHLGEKLSLPPFLEPRREEIEAGLKPIPTGKSTTSR